MSSSSIGSPASTSRMPQESTHATLPCRMTMPMAPSHDAPPRRSRRTRRSRAAVARRRCPTSSGVARGSSWASALEWAEAESAGESRANSGFSSRYPDIFGLRSVWLRLDSPAAQGLATMRLRVEAARARESTPLSGEPRAASAWDSEWRRFEASSNVLPRCGYVCRHCVSFHSSRRDWNADRRASRCPGNESIVLKEIQMPRRGISALLGIAVMAMLLPLVAPGPGLDATRVSERATQRSRELRRPLLRRLLPERGRDVDALVRVHEPKRRGSDRDPPR